MRSTRVKVLPVPGPATTASAAASDRAAAACSWFIPAGAPSPAATAAAAFARALSAAGFFASRGRMDMSNIAVCPASVRNSPGANSRTLPYSPS